MMADAGGCCGPSRRMARAEAIRTKVKSKMNTAAPLGTVIVGLTTFLLQDALQKEPSVLALAGFCSVGCVRGALLRLAILVRHAANAVSILGQSFPVREQRAERGLNSLCRAFATAERRSGAHQARRLGCADEHGAHMGLDFHARYNPRGRWRGSLCGRRNLYGA